MLHTDLLRRGVLIVDGDEHDHYRGLMEPPLHPAQLPAYSSRFVFHTDRVSAQWRDGGTVDMLVEARKIALLIIMDTAFSRDAWDDLPHISTPILKAIEYISPGAWIFWRNMPRPGFKRHLEALDEYLYRIIADRRMGAFEQDLLQHLIDARLTDDVIRDQMLTMLIAGHDTSTALLAWTFALLGQHPDIHTRVVNEVDAMEKSPLLDQVIKESLRLYPPIHIGNRRMAREMKFDDGSIPQGERMFYSIYLTHRDPSIWENADDFCPERFARGRKTPPFSYVPFGGGPRACIGGAFGQAEARIVMARLLRTHAFAITNHPYSSSKAAASIILESARVELKKFNMKVITVRPGFVRTDMTTKNEFRMPFLMEPEKAARIIRKGLEKGRSVVNFPFFTSAISRITKLLPNWIYDPILGKLRPMKKKWLRQRERLYVPVPILNPLKHKNQHPGLNDPHSGGSFPF